MTNPDAAMRRVLGRTGLEVSAVCVGTAAWGTTSPVHGVELAEGTVLEIAERSFAGPLNFLDTSNGYGDGESERRIGLAIRVHGGLPDGFVVQTKLDRDPETGSFSRERMERSIEESLERLGLDRVPLLYLHDPEHIGFEASMADDGPVAALVDFRDRGLTDAIGISGGPVSMLTRFVETEIFDALITHNRYTLVDRRADALIGLAARLGLGVVNGAVYGGGVLARFPRTRTRYHYAEAPPALLARIDAMGAACARFSVPLGAAALQFSLRDPRVHSTICGMVGPMQLDATLELARHPIPEELWTELDELCPPEAQWIVD